MKNPHLLDSTIRRIKRIAEGQIRQKRYIYDMIRVNKHTSIASIRAVISMLSPWLECVLQDEPDEEVKDAFVSLIFISIKNYNTVLKFCERYEIGEISDDDLESVCFHTLLCLRGSQDFSDKLERSLHRNVASSFMNNKKNRKAKKDIMRTLIGDKESFLDISSYIEIHDFLLKHCGELYHYIADNLSVDYSSAGTGDRLNFKFDFSRYVRKKEALEDKFYAKYRQASNGAVIVLKITEQLAISRDRMNILIKECFALAQKSFSDYRSLYLTYKKLLSDYQKELNKWGQLIEEVFIEPDHRVDEGEPALAQPQHREDEAKEAIANPKKEKVKTKGIPYQTGYNQSGSGGSAASSCVVSESYTLKNKPELNKSCLEILEAIYLAKHNTVSFQQIENIAIALGATVNRAGSGSRVRFGFDVINQDLYLCDFTNVMHKPHNTKDDLDGKTIRQFRDFLKTFNVFSIYGIDSAAAAAKRIEDARLGGAAAGQSNCVVGGAAKADTVSETKVTPVAAQKATP